MSAEPMSGARANCLSCKGTGWCDDQNWSPQYIDLPHERIEGDGLIRCMCFMFDDPDASAVEAVPVAQKYDDVLLPFLALMRAELHDNAGKGDRPGWLGMSRATATLEIYHHVAKLAKAARDDDADRIREHSADVANMAMMLLDVCGHLPPAASAPDVSAATVHAALSAWRAAVYPSSNCTFPDCTCRRLSMCKSSIPPVGNAGESPTSPIVPASAERANPDKRDAERYRWLRENADTVIDWDCIPTWRDQFKARNWGCRETLDAAIDAALTACKPVLGADAETEDRS